MNDKIEISLDLAQRLSNFLPLRGADLQDVKRAIDELRALLEEPSTPGARKTTKEALEEMSQKDWGLVLEKGMNLQLLSLVKSYKKIIGRYQHLCGELYQVLGVLDAPTYVLDRVLNASESMVITNTPSLLPFDKHAWPTGGTQSPPFRNPGPVAPVSPELVQLLERAKVYARGPFLDEINACLDKVKELNQ